MAQIEPKDLREKLERRLAAMQDNASTWRKDAYEVARYSQPRFSAWIQTDEKGTLKVANAAQGKRNDKLLDGYGIYACNVCSNGMNSGMASAASDWFMLEAEDPDLSQYQAAKEWMDDTKRRMQTFIRGTNAYQVFRQGDGEIVRYGTEAAVMVENFERGAVNHPLTAGEYWLAANEALEVDTLYRRCDMTVRQTCERFGDKASIRVRTLYDNGDYETIVPIMHAIEPNLEREWGKIDGTNKLLRSVYWEYASDKTAALLEFGGFEERPFWAPRWDTNGSEVWGYGPGLNFLPEGRQRQLLELRKQQAIDYMVKPHLLGPASGEEAVSQGLHPGRVTFVAAMDKDTFRPAWEVDSSAITALSNDKLENKQAIDRALYVDFFLAFSSRRGVQPLKAEEIARLYEEELQQLGPVVDRNQNEKYRAFLDRCFAIMLRTGRLAPPPEELQDQQLKVVFVSAMARAQRMIGVESTERYLSFTGNLAAVYPDALDKANVDEMLDDYADRLGVPAAGIRSAEEVEQIRAARALAQQRAQALAAAPAVKDGAQAARLLSETDMGGGQSALQRMMGQPA